MSNKICQEWFQKTFVLFTKAYSNSDKPILLLYNGHIFYGTLKMIDMTIEANIILYGLPLHTTYHLQLCNIETFSLLKQE